MSTPVETLATTPSSILSMKRPSPTGNCQPEEQVSMKKPMIFPRTDPPKPKMTKYLINDRIRNMFSDENVLSMPCVSARLFACFTLISEETSKITTPGGRPSRRQQQSTPLHDLLKALVHVEHTSLGHIPQKRKVHFSGFDCSSTRPPVDSILGSQHHWESSIGALETAVDTLHSLVANPTEDVITSLQSLVTFLQDIENETGAYYRQECSRSMPDYFPPDRFITAAAMYREDFANVTAHLTAAGPDDARQLHRAPLMHIEKQLADKTGQAIRFYLRLFFNPEPLRVTSTPPEELPGATANLTKRRSKVSEILTMTPPEGVATNPNSAVADGSISSVVSKALQCLYVRIGPDALLSPSFDASLLVPRQGFCTSAASQRGLPTKKCPEPITEEDIHTMIAEIHDAFTFLEVANACRFLSELVNWPGVTDEIAKVGGWSLVERYAKKIQQHGLLHCSSADAHFAPLSNVGQLFARMEQCRQVMQGPMKECELSLRSFSARFKCGTKPKAKIRTTYPAINRLSTVLDEGPQFTFPVVSKPQPQSGDEI